MSGRATIGAALAMVAAALGPASAAGARKAAGQTATGQTATGRATAGRATAALATPAESTFAVSGYRLPGTPARYDRVLVRRFGSPRAGNVLVLVPGTLAGASDFNVVAPYLATHVPHLQVWAQMRREGALEDNSMLLAGLRGQATPQQVFNYYLGWLADPTISPHYVPLAASQFGFVKQWGLATAMNDLHAVILRARNGGRRKVILGGHSLGGAEAAVYPAWDFAGHPGYRDIAGIVGIDGGALGDPRGLGPTAETLAQARRALQALNTAGPWLDLFGFGLPWITGPFAEVGALAALLDPNGPSLAQRFPLLPAPLRPPVPATNLAQLGFSFDASSSPPALALIHVHSGHLAPSGDPRGWVDAGPTPASNIARAFAVEPLGPVDWYYPQRLSIDVVAANALRETAAARYLGLRLFHTHQVNVPLYVIQTSLGGTDNAVADGARAFRRTSRIPSVEVVDRASTYGHLDPLLATPAQNAFLQTVIPWLQRIGVH